MKVTLYKAADGGLHNSFKDFSQRQIELRVLPAAQKLVDSTGGSGVNSIDGESLTAWIAGNGDALRKLLNDAQVAKRPRKVVKAKPVVEASEVMSA